MIINPFIGPLIPRWGSGDVCHGFQSQGRPLACIHWFLYKIDLSDSPLVRCLLAAWQSSHRVVFWFVLRPFDYYYKCCMHPRSLQSVRQVSHSRIEPDGDEACKRVENPKLKDVKMQKSNREIIICQKCLHKLPTSVGAYLFAGQRGLPVDGRMARGLHVMGRRRTVRPGGNRRLRVDACRREVVRRSV